MIWVVEIFCGDIHLDLMIPHTKNIEDIVNGYFDIYLQQVSNEPIPINKLIHFSKINKNVFLS